MYHWLIALLLGSAPGGVPAAVPMPPPAPPAATVLPCTGYAAIRDELARHYAEAPVSAGLQSNGHLLQLFASAGNGTWTMVSLAPDGQACVVAAGSDWQSMRPALSRSLPPMPAPPGPGPAAVVPEIGA